MTRYKYVTIAKTTVDDPRNDIPAGRQTLHAGKDPDPDYSVMLPDGSGLKLITHETAECVELPYPMSKSAAFEYARQNAPV